MRERRPDLPLLIENLERARLDELARAVVDALFPNRNLLREIRDVARDAFVNAPQLVKEFSGVAELNAETISIGR